MSDFDELDKFFTDTTLSLKKDFYKAMFYLATGTLAASLTLTQSQSPHLSLSYNYLFWAWFFLGITTVMILLFFLISESRFKYLRKNIKFEQSDDYEVYKTFIEGELEEYLLKQEHGAVKRFWIKHRLKVVNFFYDRLSLLTSITFITGFIFMVLHVREIFG